MKPQPDPIPADVPRMERYDGTGYWWASNQAGMMVSMFDAPSLCPYGLKGHKLWVKETHIRRGDSAIYKADLDAVEAAGVGAMYGGWKPSIFCKRIHSRITLEITSVRVERLQDISEDDAIAEGIESKAFEDGTPAWKDYSNTGSPFENPVRSYQTLWESINGKGSWERNPWVWPIQFRRLV